MTPRPLPIPAPLRPRLPRLALPAALLLAVGALLLAAGCAPQRKVVMEDEATHRRVTLLTGTEPPQTPAAPDFATLPPLELEASLGRIIVRPGTWNRYALGDPTSLLGPDQLRWARNAVAPLLHTLKPDQRVELHFRDRFKKYRVTVQIYPAGPDLVYYFTELMPEPYDDFRGVGPDRKPPFAEVQVQPGQQFSHDDLGYTLRDRVFGRDDTDVQLAQKLDDVRRAQQQKRATESQLDPVRDLLRKHPGISREALARYLDKLELLNKARTQGLFSESEATQRERTLLDDLAGK